MVADRAALKPPLAWVSRRAAYAAGGARSSSVPWRCGLMPGGATHFGPDPDLSEPDTSPIACMARRTRRSATPRERMARRRQGYYWRVVDAEAGSVIVVLCGVCRGAGEPWARRGSTGGRQAGGAAPGLPTADGSQRSPAWVVLPSASELLVNRSSLRSAASCRIAPWRRRRRQVRCESL